MPRQITALVVPAVVIALFWSIACGSGDEDGDADAIGGAESQFCSDLASLSTAIMALVSLSSSSSVDDAEDARDDVKEAMDDLSSSAKRLADAKVKQLEDAYSEFDSAVGDLEGDKTIGQAAASLQSEALGIASAQRELSQQSSCP